MNHKKNTADKVVLWRGDAFLVIDLENDFLPGGLLAVPEGDRVIPFMNNSIARFVRRYLPVVATSDWHPNNHRSFIQQAGSWPKH